VGAETARSAPSAGNTAAGTLEDDEEVHTVDTDLGIVLDAEIDVLLDTETERASLGEVVLAELELLDLKALLEDLGSLLAAHSHVDSDLLVATDGEGTHSVARTAVDGGLTSKGLKNLRSTGKTITVLTNADVQAKLRNADPTHGVLHSLLGLRFRHYH